MEWKKIISILMAGILLLLPTRALAIDFEISKTAIEARLTKDGNVNVTEWHTYKFDGDFNGITRELQPKQNASIFGFTAFENGNRLTAEQDGNVYKVHRKGNDETITIELQYKIKGGVEKYQDGAEFYWPFFDGRNESDYGNMAITVFPPAPAAEISYVGYDAAYNKASLQDDGAVSFKMGKVSAGSNGDVRVVFEPGLFPGLTSQDGTIRGKVESEKQRLADEAATFTESRLLASNVGTIAMAIFGAVIAALYGGAWLQARRFKKEARTGVEGFTVPEEKMSLPALLYFTKPSVNTANAVSAALMDLVRKGKVKQNSEHSFELADRHTDFLHENILINLLFDKVGKGNFFSADDLLEYTKKESTAATYQEALDSWNSAVANEIKQHTFYNRKKGVRWFTATLGIISAAAAALFGFYGLFLLMAAAMLIALASLSFAIFYRPLTYEGRKIKEEWKQLEQGMKHLPEDKWNRLLKDEKLRAYSYLLGTEPTSTGKEARAFNQAETLLKRTESDAFAFNPVLLTAAIVAANSNSTAHASSGSATSYSGGSGVGGGGGGSGAF